MHLLVFQFTPRIKDLKETKLFLPEKMSFKELSPQVGKVINTKLIEDNWDDILRVVLSIREGTVTASDLIHTLANYPQQNRLSSALAELGKMERTLFILEWYSNPEMRRKTTAELNKGESRNGLTRAVHFHRNGEIRDRRWEQQLYRASGLSLVTSAIIYWNTVKIDSIIEEFTTKGYIIEPELLLSLSPLGWQHINLTGDYVWNSIS